MFEVVISVCQVADSIKCIASSLIELTVHSKDICVSDDTTGPMFNKIETVLGLPASSNIYITSSISICEQMDLYELTVDEP